MCRRNTILLGIALGYAETIGAFDIFIGANVLDYSGYPDCRPEFLDAFARLANLATKAGVEHLGEFAVHAPLLKMTKAEIIREGTRLGVDYSLTLKYYDPDDNGQACGNCDSCQLSAKGLPTPASRIRLDTPKTIANRRHPKSTTESTIWSDSAMTAPASG